MSGGRWIVAGGGLGGLSAAVAAARQGRRVVLLEKEPRLGGCAVSWDRGGRHFDLALHVTAAGGPGQEFRRLSEALGLALPFIRLPRGFQVRLGGESFRLPNGDGVWTFLSDRFPGSADGLQALRRDMAKHFAVYAPLFDPEVPRWRAVPPFLPRLPVFLRQAAQPVGDYLRRFVGDPALLALLFQPCIFTGLPMSRFPTINFLMMFPMLFEGGLFTVEGGGQAVTDALERRALSLGVEVRTGVEVAGLAIRGRQVTGVRTRAGEHLEAEAVIAAVSVPQVVDRWIGRDRFPAPYLRALDRLRPSLSVMVLHFGLDRPPAELGVEDYFYLIHPGPDVDAAFSRAERGEWSGSYSLTVPVNRRESGGGDASGWTLSVIAGCAPGPWMRASPEAYRAAKQAWAEQALAALENHFPGLRPHVTVTDVATPLSIQRYTGNPAGAILGFECAVGAHRPIRAVNRPPFRGLAFAGAWTEGLGGFLPSMKSGVQAVRRLARGGGP